MDLQIITPPTEGSVSSALVKANKRILHNQEDALIEFWIRAADDFIAREANISIMQQTLRLNLSAVLPFVELPRGPVISFESITYTLKDEAEVVLTSADWRQGIRGGMANVSIPSLEDKMVHEGTMTIEYNAGATDPDMVPYGLKQGVMLLTSHWFVAREAAFMDKRIMDVVKTIPFGVEDVVAQHRIKNTPAHFNGGY